MRQPSKDTWVRFAVLLAIFWLLPLASIAISQRTRDMFSIIILLFLVFPLVTLAISFLDGMRHAITMKMGLPLTRFMYEGQTHYASDVPSLGLGA